MLMSQAAGSFVNLFMNRLHFIAVYYPSSLFLLLSFIGLF